MNNLKQKKVQLCHNNYSAKNRNNPNKLWGFTYEKSAPFVERGNYTRERICNDNYIYILALRVVGRFVTCGR